MARFVLSAQTLMEHYEHIAGLCDEVSYSAKTNYDVGKVLEQKTDCSFSVHSLQAAQSFQNPSRTWFFAQGWDSQQIKNLLSKGFKRFVVDNEHDLEILLSHIDQYSIDLLLRMRLKEHTVQTGKHFVFGFYSSQLNELLPQLRKHASIEKLGIHFHRKTQNVSEWSLKEELSQSVNEKNLKSLDLVNIGGGIPSIYKNFRSETLPVIFGKIKELREWLAGMNIRMIIEPGRYLAAPSLILETTVMNIYDGNIILDASIFNSAMDTFIAHHRLLVEGEVEAREGEAYTIKGSTPDSLDIFRYRVFLKEIKIGDTIRFLNAGAYNFSTEFCQLPKLKTVIE